MNARADEADAVGVRGAGEPPGIHHPAGRVCLHDDGPWVVFTHPVNSVAYAGQAREGAAHLQLWHVPSGTSVITPSALTDHCFELWSAKTGVERFGCVHLLQEALEERPGMVPLCRRMLGHYFLWFVLARHFGRAPRLPETAGHGTKGVPS